MSDNTLTKFELEKLFVAWKLQYGEEARSVKGNQYYRVPISSDIRQNMYRILITILVEQHKYTEDDFGEKFTDHVIDTSVFEDHKDRKKLEVWRKSARIDWLSVREEFFPSFKHVEVTPKERAPRASVQPITKIENTYKAVEKQEAIEGKGGFPRPNTVIDENEDLLAGLEDEE